MPSVTDTIAVSSENKKCHLWLNGPPNSGKTYFVEKMMEHGIQIYQGPYNNDWVGFDQDLHQAIFFDEFKGQLTIQYLADLCNTFTKMNCKFGGYSKTKKVLVIVCSNYTLEECYHQALEKDQKAVEPLLARFR